MWEVTKYIYFKYILILILLYLGNILNEGLLLVTQYSCMLILLLLLKYKIWVLLPPLQICVEICRRTVRLAVNKCKQACFDK